MRKGIMLSNLRQLKLSIRSLWYIAIDRKKRGLTLSHKNELKRIQKLEIKKEWTPKHFIQQYMNILYRIMKADNFDFDRCKQMITNFDNQINYTTKLFK